MCSSCTSKECCEYPFLGYYLALSILDASGVDKLEGIKYDFQNIVVTIDNIYREGPLKTDLYTYEVIYPDLCMDPYYGHFHYSGAVIPAAISKPALSLYKSEDGNNYFLNFFIEISQFGNCPPAETLTFRLSFPSIFGDDEVREIVTYWSRDPEHHPDYKNNPKYFRNRPHLTFCYRIIFDGEEITAPITYCKNNLSRVTIILDNSPLAL